jgi:hypothetical protein
MIVRITLISKELDSVPKYHILEPTWQSIGLAVIPKVVDSYRFYSHRGQSYFSSLPGVDIYTQSNITSIIFT